MTIFISFSGEKSRTFADELKVWLEQVLPGTDVWLSSDDIDKGTIWFTEIIDSLKGCNCGIVCVTRENRSSRWLHFEAGGMSTGLGKTHVAILALDLEYNELEQPLSLFSALRLNRDGAWHLVKSFNKLSERPIKDKVLERTFDKFWPDIDSAFQMLFPDSHKSAQESEPLHIAPKPADMVFGEPRKSRPRRRSGPTDDKARQVTLFNGDKE
jgi:hypothetical protein